MVTPNEIDGFVLSLELKTFFAKKSDKIEFRAFFYGMKGISADQSFIATALERQNDYQGVVTHSLRTIEVSAIRKLLLGSLF